MNRLIGLQPLHRIFPIRVLKMSTTRVLYSNKSRGIQKKSEQAEKGELVIADSIPPKKFCRKTWAALIKKVYEVEPFAVPDVLTL